MQSILVDHISHIGLSPQTIGESRSKSTPDGLVIQNVKLQVADEINLNGRIYPYDILVKAVDVYQKNFVSTKTSHGELDHSTSPTVRLEKTSHRIESLYWDGKVLLGDILILETPHGKIVRTILESGGRIGISSRSLGNVKETNINGRKVDVVQDDLEIVCWDLVSNPSVLQASFMLTEGLDRNKFITEIQALINKILK